MADSNLTKTDWFNFLMLGKKIVTKGAGTLLETAKSKVAELTDSEEAVERRVNAQVQALVNTGWTETEACKAVNDRMKSRLDKAFEKLARPTTGDNAANK